MAVKVVDDSYIFGLIAGELGRNDGVPDALVYEVAVNAVRGIRQGQSGWPVDTSFSQQNFYADIDGSIWNNADYAKYVEDRTGAIHDYLRANIGNLLPDAAALVLDEAPAAFDRSARQLFQRSRSLYRQAREASRVARTERRTLSFYERLEREASDVTGRASYRQILRRRFDDDEDLESLFY